MQISKLKIYNYKLKVILPTKNITANLKIIERRKFTNYSSQSHHRRQLIFNFMQLSLVVFNTREINPSNFIEDEIHIFISKFSIRLANLVKARQPDIFFHKVSSYNAFFRLSKPVSRTPKDRYPPS